MAIGAGQFDEADRPPGGVQRLDDMARLERRIEPVGVEADQAETRRRRAEGMGEQPAMLLGQIEIVERAGDIEIGIGVEPVREGEPLMPQIALDLEIGIEPERFRIARLEAAAEFLGQAGRASCRERVSYHV